MINIPDAHCSLFRSCVYKQSAIYHLIVVSQILTSSPAPGHDARVLRCRMEENPPGYPHTIYEKFFEFVAAEI